MTDGSATGSDGDDGHGSPVAARPGPSRDPDVDALLDQLEELEQTVDSDDEREQVQETISLAERIPGTGFLSGQIQKYTTRDVAEAFVGAILISMPMIVEDGVFVIAEHLAHSRWQGVPVFLVANLAFVLAMSVGLLYVADIREVQIRNPILGFVPRRLVGVLAASFLAAVGVMYLWGRNEAGNPTDLELFARVTVIWTAGAFGAALGDILPGESAGYDITIENLDDIVKPEDWD
ncbi:hypothetical protein L593_12940 [Salinarchaeum sp. Harcht-Bsk1]|uniref:hypothetical protein n=1 Tax=Salinarchaeum sp. Harcht-Bsk1 TaxID=1333523 RepID=UPI0003423C5A|nr:hypothetical protein [Salinarchaeum sp. Harcht-Bsk1]AGN02527.1 hypothetical protein L593_12940 [Salinarchaeum sp. Harcht-Bsk1]